MAKAQEHGVVSGEGSQNGIRGVLVQVRGHGGGIPFLRSDDGQRERDFQTDDAVPFNWFTVSVFGKKIPGCVEYLKLFGSSALFKAVYSRFADHCTRFFKNSVAFPG